MKAKYFLRYRLIIEKLQSRPSYREIEKFIFEKFHELDKETDFSIRTFQRDKRDIEDIFDIVIKYDKIDKCYYIDENSISDTSQKLLNAFMITSALKVYDDFSNYISFEKDNLGSSNIFSQINDAIKKSYKIKIRYQKYYEDTLDDRILKPLALKEFARRWYVVAKRKDDEAGKEEIRTYGLDRILHVQKLSEKFKNTDFNLNEYFNNFYGIITDANEPFEEVVLSFDAFQGKYVKSLPLHHSQEIIKDAEDELVIKLKLHITLDFKQKLLSYGSKMKVVKPTFLREKIIDELRETLSLYE